MDARSKEPDRALNSMIIFSVLPAASLRSEGNEPLKP